MTLRKTIDGESMKKEQPNTLNGHLVSDRFDQNEAFAGIVTRSPKMRELFQYIAILSRSLWPVLVLGEPGTGKKLVAQAIYRLSGSKGKFVTAKPSGLDDTEFFDAIFGHEKGACTGAVHQRDGLIINASGGVLFLDEIGGLSESSQVRLSRLIQEQEYYPFGSDVPRTCQARIVCASSMNLTALVAEGKFRKDLFFRLYTHIVMLPPLRDRKEDIPLLLNHFIEQAANNLGIAPPTYPPELPELLVSYHFPGNIPELQGMAFDGVAHRRSGKLSLEPFLPIIRNTAILPPDPLKRIIFAKRTQP